LNQRHLKQIGVLSLRSRIDTVYDDQSVVIDAARIGQGDVGLQRV
jgi:hypothetical protein